MRLVPCSGCRRHADARERACPFCGEPLVVAPERPRPRVATLTRAAIFYLGASVASVGCGGATPEEEPVVQPYGAPPDPPPQDPEPPEPEIRVQPDDPTPAPDDPRPTPEVVPVPAYGGPAMRDPQPPVQGPAEDGDDEETEVSPPPPPSPTLGPSPADAPAAAYGAPPVFDDPL